jgi:hypothetical protein
VLATASESIPCGSETLLWHLALRSLRLVDLKIIPEIVEIGEFLCEFLIERKREE